MYNICQKIFKRRVDETENPFKGGYKFSNGLPLSDELKVVLDKFYVYSKKQGNPQTKREVYDQIGDMLMDALNKLERHKR